MNIEEFQKARTDILSRMLDNPDIHGIYPTTICFEELDALFASMIPKWNSVAELLPEHGLEVVGFNESWIHPDYNPEGTCVCFLQDGEPAYWLISKWCGQHDEWHTRYSHEATANLGEGFGEHDYIDAPTHWVPLPSAPLKLF